MKPTSIPVAIVKARRYCAIQERCRSELRLKLEAWGVDDAKVRRMLDQLEKEGFLNEARFAEHYAVSKFRQKGWGKAKIRHALKEKQITSTDIAKGIKEIDDAEYAAALRSLVKKAWAREKGHARDERQQRVLRYLIGRGFEADLVKAALQG